jgi:hypothetical protein
MPVVDKMIGSSHSGSGLKARRKVNLAHNSGLNRLQAFGVDLFACDRRKPASYGPDA